MGNRPLSQIIQGDAREVSTPNPNVCPCGSPAAGKAGHYCARCVAGKRHKHRKYIMTPEIERMVREVWRSPDLHGKAAGLYVQERTGWPRWAVNRLALELGVARREPKEPDWSEKEVAILEQYVWMSPDRIAMRLKAVCGTHRSRGAIILKRKRLKFAPNGDGYSSTALAGLLGIDAHKVTDWIKIGALRAQKRGTLRTLQQGGDINYIPHMAVHRFLLRYPGEYDLCKVDKMWFLDTITGGKVGGRK